jgi:hypothetical protein
MIEDVECRIMFGEKFLPWKVVQVLENSVAFQEISYKIAPLNWQHEKKVILTRLVK